MHLHKWPLYCRCDKKLCVRLPCENTTALFETWHHLLFFRENRPDANEQHPSVAVCLFLCIHLDIKNCWWNVIWGFSASTFNKFSPYWTGSYFNIIQNLSAVIFLLKPMPNASQIRAKGTSVAVKLLLEWISVLWTGWEF